MKLTMVDTDLSPESDEFHGLGMGICILIEGEEEDKHPRMSVVLREFDLPKIREVWERGKGIQFLAQMNEYFSSPGTHPNDFWEHLLSLGNEEGEHARAIEAGKG